MYELRREAVGDRIAAAAYMHTVADRLCQVRRERGLTQNAVAILTGLSVSYINDIEHGKAPRLSVPTLYKLCVALRVSADYLLALPEDGSAQESRTSQRGT